MGLHVDAVIVRNSISDMPSSVHYTSTGTYPSSQPSQAVGGDRSIVGTMGGLASVENHASVEKLPPETGGAVLFSILEWN
jgi:hypothetical protein